MRLRKSFGIMGLSFLVMAFIFGGPAMAQQGLYLGTGVGGAFPQGWEDEVEGENGLDLQYVHIGYNFNDNMGINLIYGSANGTAKDYSESLGVGMKGKLKDLTWIQNYIVVNGRYTWYAEDGFSPYIELGMGQYDAYVEGDAEITGVAPTTLKGDGDFDFDQEMGYRLAVGGNWAFGNWYVSPELAYHMIEYEEGDGDLDVAGFSLGGSDIDLDDATANMITLLVKLGYHFK